MNENASEQITKDHAILQSVCPAQLGRTPSRIEPMLAGLGTRRFHRIFFENEDAADPATLIARFEAEAATTSSDAEAPPAWLPEPSLEPLRSFLSDNGIPVPASALHDSAHALDLLEDVGDRTLGDLANSERQAWTRVACSQLPRLQSLSPETPGGGQVEAFHRPFDRQLVASKAWKWLQWTIPLLLGRPASDEETRETHALFDHIASLAVDAPLRLAHRDFKAENLHLLTSGPDERLVWIDVQGAFMAPPEYDLVCVLYDLQVDHDEAFVESLFAETRAALPDTPPAEVSEERFDALAIARVCKDVAHVVHAGHVRNDPRRWHEIPRGLELISRAAGRRAHTFPGARALSCVIEALTEALESADSSAGTSAAGEQPAR